MFLYLNKELLSQNQRYKFYYRSLFLTLCFLASNLDEHILKSVFVVMFEPDLWITLGGFLN